METKFLGISLLGALVIGIFLMMLKVPRKIVTPIAFLVFVYGVFQMYKIVDI